MSQMSPLSLRQANKGNGPMGERKPKKERVLQILKKLLTRLTRQRKKCKVAEVSLRDPLCNQERMLWGLLLLLLFGNMDSVFQLSLGHLSKTINTIFRYCN